MSDTVFVSDEQIYCATFGAMMTRQVMDHINKGRGIATDADMDRFAEEANAVALLTLEAASRCRVSVAKEKQESNLPFLQTTCGSCGWFQRRNNGVNGICTSGILGADTRDDYPACDSWRANT